MIDTKINHITKSGANIFSELGFDADDAEHLQNELQQKIQNEKEYQGKLKIIAPKVIRFKQRGVQIRQQHAQMQQLMTQRQQVARIPHSTQNSLIQKSRRDKQ
ncbi:MAG: hypothetical protein QX194_04770 [Methylococcales bacterium]